MTIHNNNGERLTMGPKSLNRREWNRLFKLMDEGGILD